MADIKTLERLSETMRKDALRGTGLNNGAVLSIAEIIDKAIGAPLSWPSREAGCNASVAYYSGSPDLRHAFNAGVKWVVENYQPTTKVSERFGKNNPTE